MLGLGEVMALELVRGGQDDDALEGVIVPAQRQEVRLCIDCGQNPTPQGHSGEPMSGYAARCDWCAQRRDEAILDRSRPCSCDKTVHEPGGLFCQRRAET
jgi:hypothetical protein